MFQKHFFLFLKFSCLEFSKMVPPVDCRDFKIQDATAIKTPPEVKYPGRVHSSQTPWQNVYSCARLSISGLFFSHTFQSDQSLPRALGFILCAACGSVVLFHAARVFDDFVVIAIAFMDNQAQITETISPLDSQKVR